MSGRRDITLWLAVVEELKLSDATSNREIARRVGAEHHVVARVRREWLDDPEGLELSLQDPEKELRDFFDEVESRPWPPGLLEVLAARETSAPEEVTITTAQGGHDGNR